MRRGAARRGVDYFNLHLSSTPRAATLTQATATLSRRSPWCARAAPPAGWTEPDHQPPPSGTASARRRHHRRPRSARPLLGPPAAGLQRRRAARRRPSGARARAARRQPRAGTLPGSRGPRCRARLGCTAGTEEGRAVWRHARAGGPCHCERARGWRQVARAHARRSRVQAGPVAPHATPNHRGSSSAPYLCHTVSPCCRSRSRARTQARTPQLPLPLRKAAPPQLAR
jgi:hypothetical protein